MDIWTEEWFYGILRRKLMTNEQEEHLLSLKRDFAKLVDVKYRKGQEEHGGDLFELDTSKLLEAAIDEAIDQVVYLLTLKSKLSR